LFIISNLHQLNIGMAIAPVREAGQRFAFNFQGVERDTPFVKSACLKSGNQRIVLNSRELSSVYEELGQVIALARVELEGTSRDRWGGVAVFFSMFLTGLGGSPAQSSSQKWG